jgi:dolichol-phosphate mannosyltransferase
MIEAVFSLERTFDILIVDDGSPDGTGNIVKVLQQTHADRLFLMEREKKLGLGTAYITGFRFGLKKGYDFIFEMDADFSHNPEDLNRMLKQLETGIADVVVGSRYIPGGQTVNWPRNRKWLSYGASIYVRIITWMSVKDPTAGFVGYSTEVLKQINLDKIEFIGYAFQIEMKFAARSLGYRIHEIPITFTERTEGKSKMNKSIVREAIIGVFKMKWKSFFSNYH